MTEEKLKSAYELAMERLRVRDEEEGVVAKRPLTDEQKEEIGRLRADARAKHAEIEILHAKHVAAAEGDPEKLAQLEKEYEIDRGRIESSLEEAVAHVRDAS